MEIDGLRQQENNIVIIAATNVPGKQIGPAHHAGRIERKIYVALPTLQVERIDLFKYYLTKVTTDASVDPQLLGRKLRFLL